MIYMKSIGRGPLTIKSALLIIHITIDLIFIWNISATKPTGLLASFWNVPIFTPGSTDPLLSDKAIYTTLVRMAPAFSKMGAAIVEIFEKIGWSHVVMISRRIVSQKFVFCDYASRSIEEQFRANNLTLADWIKIDDGLPQREIDEVLRRVNNRGRSMCFLILTSL